MNDTEYVFYNAEYDEFEIYGPLLTAMFTGNPETLPQLTYLGEL